MSKIDWLAGLLEGEGCFYWHGHAGCVQLTMTDLDVVEHAALAFPGASAVSVRPATSTEKAAFTVVWCGRKAADLMWAVLPYMGGRRSERILTLLADWLEHTMIECRTCGVEFHADDARNRYCTDPCRPGRLAYQNQWARTNRAKAANRG